MGPLGPQWALPTSVFNQAGKMSAADLDPYEANEDVCSTFPHFAPRI